MARFRPRTGSEEAALTAGSRSCKRTAPVPDDPRENSVLGSANSIARAIRHAAAENAPCLILQLDTPGGLLDSTKEIVQAFYAAPSPTVVYVAPPGATASSAGCFLTLAADVAAMAPNTSIGAAHPVGLGGGGEMEPDAVMKQKLENFAASYIAR